MAREPDGGFSWRGRRLVSGPEGPVADLARRLVVDFHRTGAVEAGERAGRPASTPAERRAFVAALSAALPDRERWDDGWTLIGEEDDRRVVAKRGVEVWVDPSACASVDGRASTPGDAVRVRVPAERRGRSRGFLFVYGARIPEGRRTRIYLDLDAPGVRWLLERTGGWNAADLPFGLKVVADPADFARRDTAVVFVPRGSHDRAARLLVADGVGPRTRGGAPAFARRVAPGIGIADDPDGNESLGERRCRQLAEAIARARADASPEERMRIVEERFAEDDVSLDAPWLEPGGEEYDSSPWTSGPAGR